MASFCLELALGEDCWFLRQGDSPRLVSVYGVSGPGPYLVFSYLPSWFMGRRPEYTDPKVVAQGEGREGKA